MSVRHIGECSAFGCQLPIVWPTISQRGWKKKNLSKDLHKFWVNVWYLDWSLIKFRHDFANMNWL